MSATALTHHTILPLWCLVRCVSTDVIGVNVSNTANQHGVIPHTVPPLSSGHNFNFKTLDAMDSTSLWVSSGATAAKTKTPFPIEEINRVSIVTEADATLCNMAVLAQWISRNERKGARSNLSWSLPNVGWRDNNVPADITGRRNWLHVQ